MFSIFSLAYYQLRNLGEVKNLAIERMEELTGRKVSIGDAEMGIVRGLSILLKDVSVKSRWSPEPELTARSVWVVVKLLPLLEKRVAVKQIIVQGASLQVFRNALGQFSLGDVQKWISQPADSELFKILKVSLMSQIMVEDGSIHFLDYLDQPKDKPLSLEMNYLHFSVRKSLVKSHYKFALKGEIPNSGASTAFKVSGAFDNFSEEKGFTGISIDGKIRLNPLNVSRFQPYFKKILAKTPGWLSIDSSFSGNLGGALKTEGVLKYSFDTKQERAVIRDAHVQHRGGLEYKISMEKDSINIEELKTETGPFKFKASGSLKNIFSKDPVVLIDLKTDTFQVNRSIDYLPLKIFPEEYHEVIHKTFKNGSVKFNSFKFNGTVNQLKEISKPENCRKITVEIEMRKMDWQSPLPPLKKVTGTFKVDKGNSSFYIQKARYETQPLTNLKGTIENFITHPVADLSLENKVDMAQFHRTLKKAFKGHPIHNAISIYSDIEGSANIKLNVKGPLEDFDKLAIAGVIDLQSVSLAEKEYEPRVKKLNGKIIYTHTPEVAQRKNERWIRFLQYKNLSGNFSNSKFTNLNGELGFSNGELLEKGTALYHLDFSDLHWIIEGDPGEALVEFKEGLDFTSGGVLVNYRYQENPEKPETEKEWGKIELKNLSIKYRDRLQAIMDLNGNISYDVENIRLDNIVGRYGDSPLHLEGEIDRKDASALEFSLRLNFPDLLQTDLKDIPVFSDFNYSGPAHISMNISGTPENFKFEQQADLTRTGYEIPGLIKKNENALNKFRAKGRLSEKDGLDIEGWSYELRGNKITGSMHIPDLNIKGFKFELASEDFQTFPSYIFSDSWTADGSVNFKISGDGNLNELEDSRFTGKMDLINLKIRPEKISSEWLLNAKLRFKENRYDIRSASIVSANSKVDISGFYQGGDSPNLELILTGDKFDIDELLPESQEEDTKVIDFLVTEDFFQKGEGQIFFDVGQLNFKMLHLNKVAGKFSLNDKVLRLTDLNVGDNPLVKSSGEYAIDEKGVSTFEGRVEAKDVKTENIFSLFGNVLEKSLSGDVKKFNAKIKGKGKDGAEILKSLSGKISLDIQSGMMDQEKLRHGVHKIFGSGPGSLPLKDITRSSFKKLSGDFIPKGGIFKTENFIFETDNRRTSIVGTFDLQKNKMDTVVGVAPLAKLDRFLTKIPLFGKILTAGDEKSLLKTYYKVKGDFDDPKISAIPFTSLGKKVMGIFQGILETPVEILES
ncbi:AsmA-like C-terminal domain-containing protein, partial [Nitrospinaceae bacterium]|nr:AsmA-like C-terminal domain-containing protein [Nitrospinaceae bacterium]